MINDAASIYAKIADLMRYTPESPGKKFLWKKKVQSGEQKEDEDDEFDEDDEDEEKEDL
jgi:hypothetical protein